MILYKFVSEKWEKKVWRGKTPIENCEQKNNTHTHTYYNDNNNNNKHNEGNLFKIQSKLFEIKPESHIEIIPKQQHS